jgi:hypothetical protein
LRHHNDQELEQDLQRLRALSFYALADTPGEV